MKCKKCRKEIPKESIFCMWCGIAQKKDRKKKMYQRPDGLYEKILVLDGKRVPFRGKTEAEVFKKISAYEAKKDASRAFKEVADEWEDNHFNSISLTTQKTYKPCIKRALEVFGDTPIKDITSQMVQSFMESMARKNFAQKTVANQRIVLNLIFDYAGLHDGLTCNPMDFTKIPKGLKKIARELPSDADIKKIKENINHPFGLFPFFILYTGCRRGEALALQFKDIDRENKVIHIRKSIFYFTNKPEIKEPKTKAGIRDLPLLDVLAEKIPDGKPDDFVFSPDGQPYHSSRLTRAWKKYCNDTGISCTPYQLRHPYVKATTKIKMKKRIEYSQKHYTQFLIYIICSSFFHEKRIHTLYLLKKLYLFSRVLQTKSTLSIFERFKGIYSNAIPAFSYSF